jgi:hypothetical protein
MRWDDGDSPMICHKWRKILKAEVGERNHLYSIVSNNSEPFFFGEFTCLLTGQTFRTLSPAGLSTQ